MINPPRLCGQTCLISVTYPPLVGPEKIRVKSGAAFTQALKSGRESEAEAMLQGPVCVPASLVPPHVGRTMRYDIVTCLIFRPIEKTTKTVAAGSRQHN